MWALLFGGTAELEHFSRWCRVCGYEQNTEVLRYAQNDGCYCRDPKRDLF